MITIVSLASDESQGELLNSNEVFYEAISETEASLVNVIRYDSGNDSYVVPSTVELDGKTYTVTTIGKEAFYGTEHSITDLTLPDTLTTIEEGAFLGATQFTELMIPDSVTYIGDNAFNNASNLQSINIPKGLGSIGNGVFAGTAITGITIPENIESIGDNAFILCEELTTVVFESDEPPSIGDGAFATNTEIMVYTPGWNPEGVFTTSNLEAYDYSASVIWANPVEYEVLEFLSNPKDPLYATITYIKT